jgi:predicted NBD/HSP70 family sugar kinase
MDGRLEHQSLEDGIGQATLPTDEASHRVALGVYIRKDGLVGVVVDVHGQIVKHLGGPDELASIAHPLGVTDRDSVVQSVARLARDLAALHPAFKHPVGLGVTLSGLVGPDNREVRRSDRLGWREQVPLAELLEIATGYRVMVEHDAKVLALDEQHFGLGQGRRSFAVVTADVGVGAALVIDYRLWRGAWDEAGELGHTTLPLGRRQCICGNVGCLETVAGSDGILQSIRESGLQHVDNIDAAASLAREGSQEVREAFARAGSMLGIGLSWLVNLMNLELVVVRMGPELRATDDYERQARLSFHEGGFHDVADRCELVFQNRDQQLGARSAGSMALQLLNPTAAELGDEML